MYSTRDELIDTIIGTTGRDDKEDQIVEGLNFGLVNLMSKHPFDKMRKEISISISSGDYQAQIPDGVGQLCEGRLIQPLSPVLSYPLVFIRKLTHVRMYSNPSGSSITGKPYVCYRDANKIVFDRICDASYTIRLTTLIVPKLRNNGEQQLIQTADEALVAYATAWVFKGITQFEAAVYWDNQYKEKVQDLINFVIREIGLTTVAREWTREPKVSRNNPWEDPFAMGGGG